MTRHVLIEVSGGVVTNAIVYAEDGGAVTVWLRDYDNLHEEGYSDREAERVPPVLYSGVLTEPPKEFTRGPQ